MPAITAFFSNTFSFIGYALSRGLIAESLVADANTIMAAIVPLLKGATEPTAELAASIVKFLEGLTSAGVLSGSISATLIADAQKFSSFVSDIKSGQVGIEGRSTLFGVTGSQVFIPDGCEMAKALGIS